MFRENMDTPVNLAELVENGGLKKKACLVQKKHRFKKENGDVPIAKLVLLKMSINIQHLPGWFGALILINKIVRKSLACMKNKKKNPN